MKIEVYPSLGQALESLGNDELLYTNYSLVENPLTIKVEIKRIVRLNKRHIGEKANIYIDSGVSGKVVEIGWYLDKFDE